jgi:DNA-binding NarL/FixJ family response regulator
MPASKGPLRIAIIDDHPNVRAGIRHLLAGITDIEIVGEASNGVQAIQLAEELSPDILVLDVEMPVLGGLQVAAELKKRKAAVRILALSAYDDTEYIQGMLDNGAAGYLLKDEAPAKLLTMLRTIAAGQQGWLSQRSTDLCCQRSGSAG